MRVGDDGAANVPLVGKVELAGLELEGAEQAIAAAGVHRGVFRNPHVTVTMKRPRVNKVTVIGAVEKPGVYELPRGSSALLAALVAAGGLTDEASTEVEIRRPQRGGVPDGGPMQQMPRERLAGYVQAETDRVDRRPACEIDLVSAAQEGRGGYYLDDGDVVMVEPARSQADPRDGPGAQAGPVRAAAAAGNAPAGCDRRGRRTGHSLGGERARHSPGGRPPRAGASSRSRSAKPSAMATANLRLAAGDVVSVEQTPATVVYDVIRKFNVGLGASLPVF